MRRLPVLSECNALTTTAPLLSECLTIYVLVSECWHCAKDSQRSRPPTRKPFPASPVNRLDVSVSFFFSI